MRISVILPTFNRELTLERAISSILKQTYKEFELIIIDDGSNDTSISILERYIDNPAVRIYHQANNGVSCARNLGVAKSQYDWIAFLDSDDEWMPHKLQAQVSFIQNHQWCKFLHSEEHWIRNGVRVNPKSKHKKSNENIFLRSLEHCLISPSTVMMMKELFIHKGGFNPSFVVCEDYDLWLKILATEEIGFIPVALSIKHGGHDDQLSTKYPAMDYFRIRSMISLLENSSLDAIMVNQVREVIAKKAPILMKGFQKHENSDRFEEIKKSLQKNGISWNKDNLATF